MFRRDLCPASQFQLGPALIPPLSGATGEGGGDLFARHGVGRGDQPQRPTHHHRGRGPAEGCVGAEARYHQTVLRIGHLQVEYRHSRKQFEHISLNDERLI